MQSSIQSLARGLSLATLLFAGAASAQEGKKPLSAEQGEAGNPDSVDNMYAAPAVAPGHPTKGEYTEAEALNPDSPDARRRQPRGELLERLHVSNQGEIAAGQLAQAQGGSRAVEFGRTLVTDHTEADRQLTAVAKQLGVSLPDSPTSSKARSSVEEGKQLRDHLATLHGTEFDRAFARQMESDHEKDISMVRVALGTCRVEAICDLLRQQLPVLQRHRQIARDLQRPAAQGRRGDD